MLTDMQQQLKVLTKVSTYSILTAIVVSSIKNLSRFKDVPEADIVRITYKALKERATLSPATSPALELK